MNSVDKSLWLFIFLCLVITVIQLVIAVLTESLGSSICYVLLVGAYADCVHRMEHVFTFLIVCIGNVIEKREKDENYSYGYGRHEFLYVFTVNLSIVIVSLRTETH